MGSPVRTTWRRWQSRAATLRQFSWADRLLLAEAAIVVTTLGLVLRFMTVQRVYAALTKSTRPVDAGHERPHQRARAIEVARLVNIAARHTVVSNTCLHRSLALWWLLRRRGVDGQLKYGARKKDGAFEAHAWVEYDDVVVGDDPNTAREYLPMPWTAADSKI